MHRVTLVVPSWREWCRWVLSSSRASVTAVMEGGNEMPVCWCKTPLEEGENLVGAVFPLILSFLPYSSSVPGCVFQIAVPQKPVRLWIIVCILIRICCFFSLEINKNTPTWYLRAGEKHTVPLVLSSSLSQAFFCAMRSCCRSAVCIMQLYSLSCQKCNPCLSSCGQQWDLWKPGEGIHVGRMKSVWSCIKQFSLDSNWKSWECFEYCLKLLKACKGNLCSLQKLPTSDSVSLKAKLLHRTKLCFQTLQPSKASIFSLPMALHGAAHTPAATGGNGHFLRNVLQPRSFQVHRVAADTCPTPPVSAFSWTRVLVLAAVSYPSLLQQQPSTWPMLVQCPLPSPLLAFSHFVSNAASGGEALQK